MSGSWLSGSYCPMRWMRLIAACAVSLTGCGKVATPALEIATTNDNRRPAGRLDGDTLRLDLELRPARWFPEGDSGPGLPTQVFAERGKPGSVPGPLIRVPRGTVIHARITNTLPDSTLVLYGFHARPGQLAETLQVAAGQTRELRFPAGAPGTYFYWGSTTGDGIEDREWRDSQLSGAFIVDSTATPEADRVFVLGIWSHLADSLKVGEPDTGEVMVINGLSWPHTERMQQMVGDSVHWRVVNPSPSTHPMHLHGVYFEVDGRGDWARDTSYPPGRRPLLVTELVQVGGTLDMRWAAAEPGNWGFHCHFAFHVSPFVSMDRRTDPVHHHRMSGLVLGINAAPRTPQDTVSSEIGAARHIRLLVQSAPGRLHDGPALGYVIQTGAEEPARDSVTLPSPTLVLERGKPVAITVVNHLAEPTAVHWHGMELESYPDGVPGVSGIPPRLLTPIQPGDSFTARFTPKRAGTFIYHSHNNELEQLSRGLYAPLLVVEPGTRPDPTIDHVVLVGLGGLFAEPDSTKALVNGSRTPAPMLLQRGRPHRFRLINIEAEHRIKFSLRRDTTLVPWRKVAVDGAELPRARTTLERGTLMTGPGMTADVEFLPPGPGEWHLDVSAPGAERPWTVTLPLRVQ